MTKQEDSGTRGLPAIREARERRKVILSIPPRVFLWVFVVVAAWAIIYWKIEQGELASWRNRLLARQRAVSSELAPRYTPLRDRIEAWTMEAAGAYPGDLITEKGKASPFRSKPGVYLRLFIHDATDVNTLRTEAMESLRDGFTSCFTTFPNPNPFEGPACTTNSDCKSPARCNEYHHCTPAAQPYNLRVAYRGARVLYDNWAKEVREANSDMRLRLLERDFDVAVNDDIPVTIDLMTFAQYYLLVLDEESPEPLNVPDAGTYSESLQAVEHPVRIFAWDLASNELLLRVRTSVSAVVTGVGEYASTALAVRRQSNNCAIAVHVRHLLGDDPPPGSVLTRSEQPDAGTDEDGGADASTAETTEPTKTLTAGDVEAGAAQDAGSDAS